MSTASQPSPLAPRARRWSPLAAVADWIADLGELVEYWFTALGDFFQFAFRTFSWLLARAPRRETLLPNFYQIGVLSLPVVAPLLDVMKSIADSLQGRLAVAIDHVEIDADMKDVWSAELLGVQNEGIHRLLAMFDREFFESGVAYLKPMILRDVAEAVGMHESTISRVTTSKYMHTPQGLFELKYFFNSSIRRAASEDIASESVKQAIKKLIDEEDKGNPVSDQAIVEMLEKTDGIKIARSTVAKYREMLGILASSKRKRLF